MISLTLQWPAKELSPNARVHFMAKSRKVKAARSAAYLACRAAGGFAWSQPRPTVSMTFHPASKRRMDCDNLIAMHKGALDGIADALGIDDSKFILSAEIGEVRKPACVVVEIS